MTIMTEQIAALEAAFEKATKREWVADSYRVTVPPCDENRGYDLICSTISSEIEHGECKQNVAFIALSHNLMPALIAAAKERDAAFSAGRKDGIEEAANKVNAISEKFYPHAKAPYDDAAAAILALIAVEEGKGERNG